MLGKVVVTDNFNTQVTNFPDWEFANFYPGMSSDDPAAEIRGNWEKANFKPTNKGLQIRSLILRAIPTVTLRSLACEIRLSFRLTGDSTLWIITRGSDIRDPNAAIFKIRKELECMRAFCIFGGPVGPQNEFKFFNKSELDNFTEFSPESIVDDYADIRLKYHDNGDDKVWIEVLNTSAKTGAQMRACNKFIPVFDRTNVMIAGHGTSVLLKSATIRQNVREGSASRTRNTHCECCTLF